MGRVRVQLVEGALSTVDNGNCLLDAVLASKEAQGDAVLIANKRFVRGMDVELRYALLDYLEAHAWDVLPAELQEAADVRTLAELVAKWNKSQSVDEYVWLARVQGRTRDGGVVFNSLDTVVLVVLGIVDRSTYIVRCASSGRLLYSAPVVNARATTPMLFRPGERVGHWLGFTSTCTSTSAGSSRTSWPSLRGGGLSLDGVDAELPADWDDAKFALMSLLDADEDERYEATLCVIGKVPPRAPCKRRRCTATCPRCVLNESLAVLSLKETSLVAPLRGGGDAAIDAATLAGKRKARSAAVASSSTEDAGSIGRTSMRAARRRGPARLLQDVDRDEERELRRLEGGTSSPPAPRRDGSPAVVALDTPEARIPPMPPPSASAPVRTAVDARLTTVDVKDLHVYLPARNKQLLVRLMSATQKNYENERGTGTVATLLAADHTSDVELTFWNMPVLFDRLRVGAVYCIHAVARTLDW